MIADHTLFLSFFQSSDIYMSRPSITDYVIKCVTEIMEITIVKRV